MNELQVFNNPAFGQVRTVVLDDEPFFVGKDVAEILGYSNTNKAIQVHVDSEDKFLRSERGTEMGKLFSSLKKMNEYLGRQDSWLINESGLYSLILSSKLPTAKKFKRWVTRDVLPSIRKHGGYLTPEAIEQTLTDPDYLIRLATELKAERNKRISAEAQVAKQSQIIGELKPKADYTDTILANKGTVTITQIAKDYGMSGQAMSKLLHQLKVIYQCGGQWLLYSKYQTFGYTHSKTIDFNHHDGRPDVKMHTEWTQKGRLFLYNLLKKNGKLPVIERDVKQDI